MNLLKVLVVVCAILALPFTGYAQEAVISGTVTDTTGGVLPGVTMTAVHEATGTTFLAVSDEIGGFRIPTRVGGFLITADLPAGTRAWVGRWERYPSRSSRIWGMTIPWPRATSDTGRP